MDLTISTELYTSSVYDPDAIIDTNLYIACEEQSDDKTKCENYRPI